MEKVQVEVRYRFLKKGDRATFLKRIDPLVRLTREEEGCERYEYFYPLTEPEALALFEVWKDESARLAHAASAHFRLLGEIKREMGIETELRISRLS